MSKILAILCIWKVTSRPLIWPLFESYFVCMKRRYGILKLFSILFNFLLACLWQAVSFQSLDRIRFSSAHFFRFVLRINRLEKIGPFCLFGPFWFIWSKDMAFSSFARFFCQQRLLKINWKKLTVILVTVSSEKFVLYQNRIILMAFHT